MNSRDEKNKEKNKNYINKDNDNYVNKDTYSNNNYKTKQVYMEKETWKHNR